MKIAAAATAPTGRIGSRRKANCDSARFGRWSTASSEPADPMPPLEYLVARVRGEYGEMPGLHLTVDQACRLWHMDGSTCETVLEQLVRDSFLEKTGTGAYVALPAPTGSQAKAQRPVRTVDRTIRMTPGESTRPRDRWLFTRGSDSVLLVREERLHDCVLFVYGPTSDAVTHVFPHVTECIKRQAEIEQNLLGAGYQLAGPGSDRRGEAGTWRGPDQRRAAG
jgi:hypothetical protein